MTNALLTGGSYANVDREMKSTSFPKDVKELTINLYQVRSN